MNLLCNDLIDRTIALHSYVRCVHNVARRGVKTRSDAHTHTTAIWCHEYGSTCWELLYQADVRRRLDLMERLRRRLSQEEEAGRPWDAAWRHACNEVKFWRREYLLVITKTEHVSDMIDGDVQVALHQAAKIGKRVIEETRCAPLTTSKKEILLPNALARRCALSSKLAPVTQRSKEAGIHAGVSMPVNALDVLNHRTVRESPHPCQLTPMPATNSARADFVHVKPFPTSTRVADSAG